MGESWRRSSQRLREMEFIPLHTTTLAPSQREQQAPRPGTGSRPLQMQLLEGVGWQAAMPPMQSLVCLEEASFRQRTMVWARG